MERQILVQIVLSLLLASIFRLLFRLHTALVATPRQLRLVLKQQGVEGPPPSFPLGNISDIKRSRAAAAASASAVAGPPDSHNSGGVLFSVFDEWRRQYGEVYTFWLGNMAVMVVNKYDVIKEIIKCTSTDLAKPSFPGLDLESLFGNGVVTSNGSIWAYQRKIIAPELFNDKVKGMTRLIQESAQMLIDSWRGLIKDGEEVEIKIDEYLRKFSGEVISRACFGSSYGEGEQLFQKLASLQQLTSKKGFSAGIPGMKYVPTKQNMRSWEVQRDVKEIILKLVKQKSEANFEKNMLQMILEGAQGSNLSPEAIEKFTIDNCKSIYFAGFETTATTASWCLMLLASNPEWQSRAREEVVRVCNGRTPDSDSIRHMKQLTMVINESLRLYPLVAVLAREALHELEFAKTRIPKGVTVWMMISALHTDPDNWGPDSYEFKPERFANGTTGACKLPHLFMPFGFGPRICLGLSLAMVELKILLSLILSNFSLSLSPKYVHAPKMNLVLEPGFGVHLVIKKLN